MPEQDVAIVGVGEARVGRDAGCTSWELHVEAAEAAFEDAGLTRADIDGLISCPSTIDDHARHHVLLAEHLGMPSKRYTESSRVGGASSTSAVRDAVSAIRAGLAEVVLITCADSQRSTVGRGDTPAVKMAHYHSADYEIPYGPLIISLYALIAQRWIHEYNWTPEQVAEVPVAQRYNASLHPNAQEKTPITIEDVVTSKMITSPLRLLNCSVISDGGAAMIVTTGERARSLKQKPVYVRGMGGAYSYYFPWNLPNYTDYLRDLIKLSADSAFEQAGVQREDIDFGMVGDPADITTLIGLEGMGYCGRGEAVDFVKGGRLKVGGSFPVNTHGGCLSYAHPGAPGQHLHMIEAVRQLRGGCGDRQVKNAKLAAVHGQAGVVTSHCTLILGNDAR
jgi:acetyl-CoA acetyltransferase